MCRSLQCSFNSVATQEEAIQVREAVGGRLEIKETGKGKLLASSLARDSLYLQFSEHFALNPG